MKQIYVIFLVSICVLVIAVPDEKATTSKYDNFDITPMLNNRRLMLNYINCFLDKGRCTKEGAYFKQHMHDVMETDCIKCTPKQKEKVDKVLKHIYENEKDSFDLLEAKYDSNGNYRKLLEK